MERQRTKSQRVMNTRPDEEAQLHGPAAALWSAIQTERRAAIEGTSLGFGQCGWRQEQLQQEGRAR